MSRAQETNQGPRTEDFVEIPPNFFYPKGSPKGQDLTNRFLIWNCLDRRTGAGRETPQDLTQAKFATMLISGRRLILKLAGPMIKTFFEEKFSEAFPEVRYNNRKISTIGDLFKYVQKGPWDNKMREIVHYSLHAMWGTSNAWALTAEQDILSILEMKYGPKKISSHGAKEKRQKNHPGDFCKVMCVNKKGSMLVPLKNLVRKVYKEAIYVRTQAEDKILGSKPGKNIPKVAWIRKATRTSYGFEGLIGICVGHLDEKNPDTDGDHVSSMPDSSPGTENAIITWLRAKLESGERVDTTDDLMRLAAREDYGPVMRLADREDNDPLMNNRVAGLPNIDDEETDEETWVSACGSRE